jgi:PAS domain S-box-containing protein
MQISPDHPIQHPLRLRAPARTALLESPGEEPFESLTRLAVRTLGVPASLITLVSGERQFFKSYRGLLPEPGASRTATALSRSFAQHVVTSGEPLLIADTRDHPLVQGNPAIEEMNFIAYAGIPLRTAGDVVLGAFSAVDHVPRAWTPDEVDILSDLSRLAMHEIDRRIDAALPAQSRTGGGTMPGQFRRIVEHSLAGVYLIRGNRFLYVNPKLAEIFGYTPDEILSGKGPTDLVVVEDRRRVEESIRKRLRGEAESAHYTFRGLRKDGGMIEVEVLSSRTEIDGEPAVVGTLLEITERKRAEEALRRREEHFRSLLENASEIIHELGADGRIRYISPSVVRVLGYRPEEMVGRAATEFVHPDDLPEIVRTFESCISTAGVSSCLGIRIRHKDGSWREVEVQFRVGQDGTEEPVAIVNTHDVTAARRVEQALRESEERYRLVARATNSAIRDWKIATGECTWNGSSNLLLRYTPDEIGTSVDWWYERIHPQDREQVINGIEAAIDGVGESWSAEYHFLRGDGNYATVLDCCHIARNERGIPVRVLGSLVDVTERKRSEDAQRFLAQASAILNEDLDLGSTFARLARLTLPTLADYCLIDLVEGNSLRRVGFAHVDPTKEEILRKNEHHPLHSDPESHPVIRAVRSREPVLVTKCDEPVLLAIGHDETHLRQLREMKLCSFIIVPLVAHGQTLGVITLAASESGRRYGPRDLLVAQDLAHRAGLAIEHGQLYDRAQEAIRAREEVLGVVSHDLRNPLSTIHLSAELLLDAGEERRAENVQSLERIRRVSKQMDQMIGDLLDMSSIESGSFAVERSRHAVAALVEEARDLLQPLGEEKWIRLECQLDSDVSDVDIDSRQILRVFSNLVGNAIKFTPEGGRITVGASKHGAEVQFSVADTGPGIPSEHIPHVFDRYWQARSGDRRGAGLGLAIAKGIVEAHGGRIWVESGENGGAVFRFSVPVAPHE